MEPTNSTTPSQSSNGQEEKSKSTSEETDQRHANDGSISEGDGGIVYLHGPRLWLIMGL